jgi:hypothetical protein
MIGRDQEGDGMRIIADDGDSIVLTEAVFTINVGHVTNPDYQGKGLLAWGAGGVNTLLVRGNDERLKLALDKVLEAMRVEAEEIDLSQVLPQIPRGKPTLSIAKPKIVLPGPGNGQN